MGLFRFKYGRMNLDQFMSFQSTMYNIGFDVSAYPGDYGNATCLNCRAIVSIGVPDMTGLQQRHMPEQLNAIGDWWG